MAARVVEMVAQYGFPQNTVLNVNVPYLPWEELKGFQITRMGTRIYRDELVRREDPRGRAYYWIGGDTPTGKLETGTDYGAMKDRLRFHHPDQPRPDCPPPPRSALRMEVVVDYFFSVIANAMTLSRPNAPRAIT